MTDNQTAIEAILAEAARVDVDRNTVLLKVSQLGQRLGGDARHDLQSRVYSLLDRNRR